MKDLSNMALIEMVNTKNNIKGINYNPEKKILYFDKIYLNYYLLLMQGIFDIRIDYALVDTFDKKLLTKQFEEQFVKNMSLYREISDFESKEKNNNLADMLNTIQIASIALTILGWVLVIYQGNIPNNILSEEDDDNSSPSSTQKEFELTREEIESEENKEEANNEMQDE